MPPTAIDHVLLKPSFELESFMQISLTAVQVHEHGAAAAGTFRFGAQESGGFRSNRTVRFQWRADGDMRMNFQVKGLDASHFRALYGLSTAELATRGVQTCLADSTPGYPCRVSLRDAEPGERLLLLNYLHQPAHTPYRSSHAIFVVDGAETVRPRPGEVPELLSRRQLAVRAFDQEHMMTEAVLVEAGQAADAFECLLANRHNRYLHVHNAARGCFLASVHGG
jgi:hypothetical protein